MAFTFLAGLHISNIDLFLPSEYKPNISGAKMKTLSISLIISLFFLVMSFQASATKITPEISAKIAASSVIKDVDLDGFLELVDEAKDLVIIDSRSSKDRLGGHIEGSLSLPDTDTTADSLAKLIDNKDNAVLFYCNGVKCGRSSVAALIAEEAGYTKIFVFTGGWAVWTENKMPVSN